MRADHTTIRTPPSRRGPRSSTSIRWALLPALGLTLLILPACKKTAPSQPTSAKQPAEAIDVHLADVVRRPVEETVDVTGTIFADEDTTISAKQAGRIISVSKDVGDVAAPQEALAQIDQRDYQLALEERRAMMAASLAKVGLEALPDASFNAENLPTVARARAEASNAQAKYERAKQLFEQDPPLLAVQDFADISTALEVARNQALVELLAARATLADARAQDAALDTAQQHLADTLIAAPVLPGRPNLRYRVAERFTSVGEYVDQGKPLFRLVVTDTVKYRVRVPERYAGRVAVDQPARVNIAAAPQPRAGRVARVSPVADPQSRTFLVEITLDNADGLLKPGAFAPGLIVLGTRENAVLVAEAAISSFAGVSRVFTVKDNKAVQHRIQPGARHDDLIEILGDNLPQEPVIVTGLAGLANGSPVRVLPET